MPINSSDPENYSILDTGEEKDFTDLVALASAISQTPIAFINLFDEKRQSAKALVISNSAEGSYRVPAINAEQDILIIEDATGEESFLEDLYVSGQGKITFYAGVPLVNEDGVILGSLNVIDREKKSLSDEQISALKIIGRQVVEKLELRKKAIVSEDTIRELRYSNLFMQKFAAVAAHDIKNPMSSILLSAQSLQVRLQKLGDDGCQRLLDLNISSTKRLMVLLDDMLAYSKSPSLLLTKKTTVNLRDLLTIVISMVDVPEDFTIRVPAEKNSLTISSVAVQQIFINLLTNAIRYNDKKEGFMEIRFREDENNYYFEVEDNGIGIDKAYHQKIFANSFTLKIVDRYDQKGSGIGLSTVKELIKALRGSIYVESVPGTGTTFYISLGK
jgi:signal transduction histidine kinase